ncbi:galactose-3-O-sulfotransferase 2-like isoform X1 [Monodelphis domestica]|uniref:Galactose-3-O-sulfotransferase 2-like n=2 Tax=Monodelphis domestica TaxID=13616 RepID=F7CU30_MONDO|nr:galactose-3-O-sulfotransferase 2-like isoform X1 [Monodelphis domestica]
MSVEMSHADIPYPADEHYSKAGDRIGPGQPPKRRKAQLVPKSQLGRFWILIIFISILCMSLQLLGNFQQISCKQEIKHLILQQNIKLQQTSQDQKNHNSTLSPHSLGSIPIRNTERTLQRMGQNQGLDPTLQEQHELSYPKENALDDVWWLSYSSSDLQPLSWGSKRAAQGKGWIPPQTRSTGLVPRAEYSMNGERELRKRMEMNGNPASRSSHSEGRSQQNNPQGTGQIDDELLIPLADTTRAQPPGRLMEAPLFGQKMSFKGQARSRTLVSPFLAPSLPDHLVSSHEATCTPKTHIFFLKVHKSASSTIMNILFRFGEQRNLTFALPINQLSQLFYPFYFVAEVVEGFTDGTSPSFDIMCHHMRFLQSEVQRVMPNDTFYFSILRNPIHLMESSFTYFKGSSSFFSAKSLDDFLNHTNKFYDPLKIDSHYSRNLMTFDFGFNHNGKVSPQHIQLLARIIENQFDLVLIAEYFDESMILLKEALCWSLDDVVSFPINQQDASYHSPLSSNTIHKIKSWNKLDWELYLHFNHTFWERIDQSMGRQHLQQEVAALRKRRKQLARICLQGEQSVHPWEIQDKLLAPFQYGKARILGYNLKNGLDKATRRACQSLVMPELQYSQRLYKRQFPQKAIQLSQAMAKKHSKVYHMRKQGPFKSHSETS